MSYYIIGTAGHIDHGKTELTKAITGIDTDSLVEEKNRGISIRLGFAYMELKNKNKVGFIDVPGHEKFIKKMIAGSSEIDIILLVIAANEGIMQQTKEHLEIISLLGIKEIIIVVTKKDLVSEDCLSILIKKIRKYIENNTLYKDFPIIFVNNLMKEGISQLIDIIEKKINKLPKIEQKKYLRIPVDRIFILKGLGTIITGTIWDGYILKGDTVSIFPGFKKIKIKSIQVHGEEKNKAEKKQRVALNIQDINTKNIKKGSFLFNNVNLDPVYKIVVNFYLLKNKNKVSNNKLVYIYHGTNRVQAKLILLEKDILNSGETMLCAFYLKKSIICLPGDKVIAREESQKLTIGGGTIISTKKNKIFRKDYNYIKNEKIKIKNPGKYFLIEAINENPLKDIKELAYIINESTEEIKEIFNLIKDEIYIINNLYISKKRYKELEDIAKKYINNYLLKFPLREEIFKETFKSDCFKEYSYYQYKCLLEFFEKKNILYVKKELLLFQNNNNSIKQSTKDDLKKIIEMFNKKILDIKNIKQIEIFFNKRGIIISEYLNYLIKKNIFIKISKNEYLLMESFKYYREKIIDYIKKNDTLEFNRAKNLLGSSRKYTSMFLEELDNKKITKKQNDQRVLYD